MDAHQNTVKAGYARQVFDLKPPFPLAGLVTLKDRIARRIRDPLGVTVVVMEGPGQRLAIINADILVITPQLFDYVNDLCIKQGVSNLYLSASHTHSGPGGWSERRGTGLFMGHFNKKILDKILSGFKQAILSAVRDLKPVEAFASGVADVPGLTMNRRFQGGPVDDRVAIVEIKRASAQDILLWSTSGHPVATAFIQHDLASADIPGQVATILSSKGVLPMFLPGAMGGLNLLFPEEVPDLETHFRLLSGLIVDGIARARERSQVTKQVILGFKTIELGLTRRPIAPVSWPPKQVVVSLLWGVMGGLFRILVAEPSAQVRIPILRIGDALLIGMPADFGVGPALRVRERLSGITVVTSHTNGFIGYVHLSDELPWSKRARPMFHYENGMAWYGDDTGDRLVEAVERAVRDDGGSDIKHGL